MSETTEQDTPSQLQQALRPLIKRCENSYNMLRWRTIGQRYGVDGLAVMDEFTLLLIVCANEKNRMATGERDQFERFEGMSLRDLLASLGVREDDVRDDEREQGAGAFRADDGTIPGEVAEDDPFLAGGVAPGAGQDVPGPGHPALDVRPADPA